MRRVLRGAALLLVAAAQEGERRDALERVPGAAIEWRGPVREYLDAVTRNWILPLPSRNPALLGMFADRDTKPYKSLLPWSGEFAGKYLTGAVQVLRLTRDPALKAHLEKFVADLLAHQAEDGYLGPFPKESRLTGKAPNPHAHETWDAWGHYHILLGFLLWHEDTGDAKALDGARKVGDLLCAKFLKTGKRVVDTGSAEMNQAVVHGLALLHARTKSPAYLELARQVVEEFAAPGAGDYLRSALAGKEFFQCPKPRWESLHPILGLAEIHRITGDADCRAAFERHWWSIAKLDRHNNGGFSSGEQAQGNPYHRGAIETCCTVAWIAMGVEMLRLTGNPVVADEIEISTLNSVAGYQSRDGAWCTYNTPMEGFRKKSTDDIAFQKRPGSEEINCCSANAPRGFGMIGDWALMTDGRGLVLNAYGPCTMTASAGGARVTIRQETEYPREGRIVLRIDPERAARFPLRLRIPHWSAVTALRVNGEAVPAKAGTYASIECEWAPGDRVELDLDFSPHFWAGERECGGKVSIYRGPILLAWSRPAGAAPAFSSHWKRYGDLWAAKEPGASVECEFTGAAIRWEGRRYDDAGKARVSIDGKETAVVDQYGPKRDVPFSWEAGGLGPGRHTIRVEVLEEKNEKSRDRFVNVTRFVVPGKPSFDARTFAPSVVKEEGPIVSVEAADADGRAVRLRDFATAGEGGAEYFTWFEVTNVAATPFTRENPLRSARPHPSPRVLPDKADLIPRFREIGLAPASQGGRDTCSLFAVTALADFECARNAPRPSPRLSVEYLVWAANESTGLKGDQAMFYEAVHGLNALGICAEALMPYAKSADGARRPSAEAAADAKGRSARWRCRWIRRWDLRAPLGDGDLLAIKAALAGGHPVACGLRWPKSLKGHELLEVPPPEQVFDGHSIAFVGYEDDPGKPGGGAFRFRNSSGPRWGDGGHGVMSYAYVRAYANDALWLQFGPPGAEAPEERFEAESMAVPARERCDTGPQDMGPWGGPMWSGGRQLFCGAQEGGFVELGFQVRKAGRRLLRVLATAAPDFGRVRVTLDGAAAGPEFDLYAGRVCPAGSLELGTHDLAPGPHRLRVAVVGRSEASGGFRFGLDAVDLLAPE